MDTNPESGPYIPRRICIGWIVSTEYIQRVLPFWRAELLSTDLARVLCGWCYDYFLKYNKAPLSDVEAIFHEKRATLDDDMAEEIETLLKSLSEEYERAVFNVEYLLDQTRVYLQEQHLRRFHEELGTRIDRGEISEAQAETQSYAPPYEDKSTYIDPFSTDAEVAYAGAFMSRKTPLVRYPKELGRFWNDEMTRDAFVALMAREKGGKSWILLDAAVRAARQGCNTVLFQAGDMTENQMLRRIGIYVAQRSDQERYTKDVWIPELDCLHHQQDTCRRKNRERRVYTETVLDGKDLKFDDFVQASTSFKRHSPCHNCEHIRGVPWLKRKRDTHPLTPTEVNKEMAKFRRMVRGRLRISTHANESLTVTGAKALLNSWERQDNFVADVVIFDYADILAPCPDFGRMEFRHVQNRIWQRLRNLSQEKHCLVITATQAKATAYKKDLLDLSDYSEDKRKYAHVTAMFGLNQSPEEKRIGILRINSLLLRDSDFATDRPIHILQRLQIGRPIMGSYL